MYQRILLVSGGTMTLAHAAYLFDLEGFRQESNVWRPDPDREGYVSLLTRANIILGETPQAWDVLNRFRYNRKDMKDYDESKLGILSTSEEQIELAFVCAWGMLKTARAAGKGLFLAIAS